MAPSPRSPEVESSASVILGVSRSLLGPAEVLGSCPVLCGWGRPTRHQASVLSIRVITVMPLLPAPEACFAPSGPPCLLSFLPQMHAADVLQGPPSHQHHHHLPQRSPLHPAQDHPQVRAFLLGQPPGPELGMSACWGYQPWDKNIRVSNNLQGTVGHSMCIYQSLLTLL